MVRKDVIAPPTVDTIFRASSIPYLCPREEVICGLEGTERLREVEEDLGLTFGVGKAVHWWLQNEVFAPMLCGRWKCLDCAAVHENAEGYGSGSWVPRPAVCGLPRAFVELDGTARISVCQGQEFLFLETQIVDRDLGISGHPDGELVYQENGARVVLEVKTMNVFKFEKARGPEPEHREQATIYGKLTSRPWILVLVMVKHLEKVTTTFRPWLFRYDERLMGEIRRRVESIREGLATATLPRRICYTSTCERARKCPVAKTCFERAA